MDGMCAGACDVAPPIANKEYSVTLEEIQVLDCVLVVRVLRNDVAVGSRFGRCSSVPYQSWGLCHSLEQLSTTDGVACSRTVRRSHAYAYIMHKREFQIGLFIFIFLPTSCSWPSKCNSAVSSAAGRQVVLTFRSAISHQYAPL